MRIANFKFNPAIRFAIGWIALWAIPAASLADVIHFYDGTVLRGKVYRVTGDIIEFKEGGNAGPLTDIQRIQLTNRNDIVELGLYKKYYGEIVYVDRFKVDLRTKTGIFSINRLRINDIVLGSPAPQPENLMPAQPPVHPVVSPLSPSMTETPSPTRIPLTGADEDEDAIPAVDSRTP